MPTYTIDNAEHPCSVFRRNDEHQDRGGTPMMIEIVWGDEETKHALQYQARVFVLVGDPDDTLENLRDAAGDPIMLYSGVPGDGNVLTPASLEPGRPDYMSVLVGMMPRLYPAVYWLGVQWRATPDAAWPVDTEWTVVDEPLWVLPRARQPEVYEFRRDWPKVHAAGPRSPEMDPMVEV
jgi:hypothetical protein